MLLRDLEHRPVCLFLVAVEIPEHLRSRLLPFPRCQLMTPEKLVKGFGVNLERCVLSGVSFQDLQELGDHILRLIPVLFVPLLECVDGRANNLNVELNVLREAWTAQIRRAYQGESTDHFSPCVSDVCLGMEPLLSVHAAVDLPGPNPVHNGGGARKEGVGGLLALRG